MSGAGDTIAAVATGSGRAGIGIVRVSGPAVPSIARAIVGQALPAREASYLPFRDADGSLLDIGIALRFVAPHSFTGEDVLELQGHGGAVVLDLLLARVLSLGARAAQPGEFSQRAFLNDKIDLAQAEAVADLVESGSRGAARAAVRSLSGKFSADVEQIVDELDALRAWLEAALDFSEEDIDFLADPDLARRTRELVDRFDRLLAKAGQGQRLRDGLTVVIAGVPNVGKSTLLNALAGVDSAIVTEIAGTTRDLLHEQIVIDDLPVHLIDTAGLRETDDPIEREGVARAERAVASADHVLVLLDANVPELPTITLPEGVPQSRVLTRIDLSPESRRLLPADRDLAVSAVTGEGMDDLRAHLVALAGYDSSLEGSYMARRRHLDALKQARAATTAALARLSEGRMPELAAEELRQARQSLEQITGRHDVDDLLGQIFTSFCVGK